MISSAQEFVELRSRNDERARHDHAPESVWQDVVQQYPEYKEWVVLNKTVPLAVLRILARDADPRVRCFVAMKRRCDDALFELLARDPDTLVRVRVARNEKAPAHVLEMLRDDLSPEVAEAVGERMKPAG